jgi:hypothetical protein
MPVVVRGTDAFDVTTLDLTTIRFGATGAEASPESAAFADVDGDGDLDFVLHFATQDSGIACGDTVVVLTATTSSGAVAAGSDAVRTVGCR